jgi:hypothetical protein
MFKKIEKMLFKDTAADQYLSDSASLQDLEQRQRQIQRGEAPFQKYAQMISRGWIQ